MATTIKRVGFGQVEPNHLSAQRTSQIYAQLPAAKAMTVLENGQFVKYDYANGECNLTGKGEFMMVFNEVKLYESKQTCKDYAMKAADFVDGVMVPRVIKTNVGDIFTTNTIGATKVETEVTKGDLLKVGENGFLVGGADLDTDAMVFEVVKEYTMADGQPAVKLMRIQ